MVRARAPSRASTDAHRRHLANAAHTDAPFPVGDRFLYPLIVAALTAMIDE